MKALNYKALLSYLVGMLVIFSSCQKEEIKEEEEEGFKVETECRVNGVDIPVTKAENAMGWTTGDGIYHREENATVAAYAKSGYELVTFYDKSNPSRNLGSSHTFQVYQNTYFKAEFRSIAPPPVTTYLVAAKLNGSRIQASITGTGSYTAGSTCVLYTTAPQQLNPDRELATPSFAGWWRNGVCVNWDQRYTFTVTETVHFECRWTW